MEEEAGANQHKEIVAVNASEEQVTAREEAMEENPRQKRNPERLTDGKDEVTVEEEAVESRSH